MVFYRVRRSCILVSSILIVLPLYVLIFFLCNTGPMLYIQPKASLKELFLNAFDSSTYIKSQQQEAIQIISDDINDDELLQDVDRADIIPQRDSSSKQIFFIETSHPEGGYLNINAREACAIESAALMHPDYKIFVLFAGRIAIDANNNCSIMINNMFKEYHNIHFRRINPMEFSKNSPMESFFKTDKIKSSKHLPTHLADILRLVTLYKYGGLYFDLDVVVVKSLAELGENFLGASTNKMLMSGTLQLSGNGIGHEFAEACLKDIAKHYRGGTWAGNGPDVVTRGMQKFCETVWVDQMTADQCKGLRALPKKTFLPIWYPSHKIYFAPSYARLAYKLVENSYTAHIFNHMNYHLKLFKGGRAPYLTLAEKYCPVVYDTLNNGDPF